MTRPFYRRPVWWLLAAVEAILFGLSVRWLLPVLGTWGFVGLACYVFWWHVGDLRREAGR
jgi:hypothetical protein